MGSRTSGCLMSWATWTQPCPCASTATNPVPPPPTLLRLWMRSSVSGQATPRRSSERFSSTRIGSLALSGPRKLPLACTGARTEALACDSAGVRHFSSPRTDV
jgi:hypothetical protein